MNDAAGRDDVVDVVSDHHQDLLTLLDWTAGVGLGDVRDELVGLAAEALRRHVLVEEHFLHPASRGVSAEGARGAGPDVEAHEQLKRLLVELAVAGPQDPGSAYLLRGLAGVARRALGALPVAAAAPASPGGGSDDVLHGAASARG